MNMPNDLGFIKQVVQMYNDAVKTGPFLKYTRIILVSILLLVIITAFRLDKVDVVWFSLISLILGFITVLVSRLTLNKTVADKKWSNVALGGVVICFLAVLTSLTSYIYIGWPRFYDRFVARSLDDKPVNDSIKNSVPIEKAEPLFDSSLFFEGDKKVENKFTGTTIANLKKGSLSIVHVSDTLIGNLPCKYFTLKNSGASPIILTKCTINIISYIPNLGNPETRELTPLVIWDITLPKKKGTFHYQPRKPIYLASNDAVIVGLRFSTYSKNKELCNPKTIAEFKYNVTFREQNGPSVKSEDFVGFK